MVSVNDTHIIVMWSAPATPNGVVNYTVMLQERNLVFNSTVVITTHVVTQLFLIEERMVKPYTEYSAIVTAQTSAGEGDSAMGSITTSEEGMIMVMLIWGGRGRRRGRGGRRA